MPLVPLLWAEVGFVFLVEGWEELDVLFLEEADLGERGNVSSVGE